MDQIVYVDGATGMLKWDADGSEEFINTDALSFARFCVWCVYQNIKIYIEKV